MLCLTSSYSDQRGPTKRGIRNNGEAEYELMGYVHIAEYGSTAASCAHGNEHVRFDILRAVRMDITVFSDVTSCRMVDIYQNMRCNIQ